jgi:hypothetical protein
MLKTPPQKTYTAGEHVKFKIGISTEHLGHYVFRICDKILDRNNFQNREEGEECLKKWVVKRVATPGDKQPVDKRHPERWHVIPGRTNFQAFANGSLRDGTGRSWEDMDIMDKRPTVEDLSAFRIPEDVYKPASGECEWCNCMVTGGETTTDTFEIPKDLECEACTLQWWWVSGNKCAYDSDVAKYYSENGIDAGRTKTGEVCSGGGQVGEEFWNCADIVVKANPNKPQDRRRRGGEGGGGGGSKKRRRRGGDGKGGKERRRRGGDGKGGKERRRKSGGGRRRRRKD